MINIKYLKIMYLIFIIFFTQSFLMQINAQDLITDRPDITESAVTVPFHFVQIETGYQYNKDGLNSAEHFGATLIRFGLTSNIELRFCFGMPLPESLI